MKFPGALKPNTRSSGAKQPQSFKELVASVSLHQGSRRFDEAFDRIVLTPVFGGDINYQDKHEVNETFLLL
jgi:hypothetical protein